MINTCIECGDKFEHRRLAKVCKSCQERPIECPICKTEFVRKATNQSCCSPECTKEHKKSKPKKPKMTTEQMQQQMEEEMENDMGRKVLDRMEKEFDVKPKAGVCVIEKCENCGGTRFIFNCGGTDNKGFIEYRCIAKGCAYSHYFRWGYKKETEEDIISE